MPIQRKVRNMTPIPQMSAAGRSERTRSDFGDGNHICCMIYIFSAKLFDLPVFSSSDKKALGLYHSLTLEVIWLVDPFSSIPV